MVIADGDIKPHFIDLARTHLPSDALQVPICRHIYNTYLDCHDNNYGKDILTITTRIEDTEGQSFIEELLQKKVNKDRAEQHFIETIQRILDRNWMERREEIKRKIHSAECSDDEAVELTKQFDALKRTPPKIELTLRNRVYKSFLNSMT